MVKIGTGLLPLALLCLPSPRAAKEITSGEARQALLVALQKTYPHWPSLPGFGLDPYRDPYFPSFIFFEVGWDNPAGSVVLGHYAVNPRTADVWEAVGCHRLSPAAIKPLQKSLRKRIGLSEEDYRRLRKLPSEAPCRPD